MEDARAIANFTLEDCIGSELAAYECLGLDGAATLFPKACR
jgi:hypothetical protein